LAAVISTTLMLAAWIGGGYAHMTVVGYRVDRLQSQLAHLQIQNRLLAEQAARLADSTRVTAQAGQLGMGRVDPSRTVYVGLNADRSIIAPAEASGGTKIAMRL